MTPVLHIIFLCAQHFHKTDDDDERQRSEKKSDIGNCFLLLQWDVFKEISVRAIETARRVTTSKKRLNKCLRKRNIMHMRRIKSRIFSLFITHWSLLFFAFFPSCLHCIMHNKNDSVQRHAMQHRTFVTDEKLSHSLRSNFKWHELQISALVLLKTTKISTSMPFLSKTIECLRADYFIEWEKKRLKIEKLLSESCATVNCQSSKSFVKKIILNFTLNVYNSFFLVKNCIKLTHRSQLPKISNLFLWLYVLWNRKMRNDWVFCLIKL